MKQARKVLAMLIAVTMVLITVPTVTNAAESDFTIKDGVLVEYSGTGGEVVIPNGVTKIGSLVFYDRTDITSVVIPDSVTIIGSLAFTGTSNLTSITLPDSITEIQMAAFSGSGLTSVTIPNGMEEIVHEVFSFCENLTSVTIPDSVTTIAFWAFGNCNLTSITIPGGVTKIDSKAFGYETNDGESMYPIKGFIVYGVKGTTAQTYALENGFEFREIGADSTLTLDVVVIGGREIIEIRNPTNNVISTKGLYLTDDENYLHKWQMPSFIIRGGESVQIKSETDTDTNVLKRAVVNFEIEKADILLMITADKNVVAELWT